MAEEKKETAEKKLLKIIENPPNASAGTSRGASSTPAPEAAELAAAVKNAGIPHIALPSFLTPLSDLLHGKLPFAAGSALAFGIKEANYILGASVLAVLAFVIFNTTMGTKTLEKKIVVSVDTTAVNSVNHFFPQPKDVSQYLQTITKRNIFKPFEKKAEDENIDVDPETRQISALTKNLKLVGISWLDSPESATALIEDTQSGMTYFLKMGEQVNNVTVKSIYADRIILTYQGEDLTIKL